MEEYYGGLSIRGPGLTIYFLLVNRLDAIVVIA